jgi:hypothetical protein
MTSFKLNLFSWNKLPIAACAEQATRLNALKKAFLSTAIVFYRVKMQMNNFHRFCTYLRQFVVIGLHIRRADLRAQPETIRNCIPRNSTYG